VEAFIRDDAPDAYERLVDGLLASPRYGEHMARYWLDAARYADTNGYHIDNERYMWPWRDWVIRSFNDNMPFDQFTVEQIAGDLLPNATRDQQIGSGFNRNHMINFEGGIIPEEYRIEYVTDRANTTGTVWLGLSVGCAKCHDHKYDPISQKEYYQFFAYFNTIEEQGIDGRDGNSVPFMQVPSPEQETERTRLAEQLAAFDAQLAGALPEVDAAQAAWEATEHTAAASRWQPTSLISATSTGGTTLFPIYDQSIFAAGTNPDKDVYEVTLRTDASSVRALRLEALADPALPTMAAGRGHNGNFVLTEFEVEAAPASAPDQWAPVKIIAAEADHAQPDFPVALAIDGNPETGWASEGFTHKDSRTAVFVFEKPVAFGGGTIFRVRLRHESPFAQHAMGRFRIATSDAEAIGAPVAGPWHHNGPFVAVDGAAAYATAYEPEQGVDLNATYPDGRMKWVPREDFAEAAINNLPGGTAANYLYRTITTPTPRAMTLAVGSNDAIKVWLNGQVVLDQDVQRGAAADQDTISLFLEAGENRLLMKVVNYGNAHQFFYRVKEQHYLPMPIPMEVLLAKAPETRSPEQQAAVRDYYRRTFSAPWKALNAERTVVAEAKTALEKQIPTTMVMGEMKEPRATHILKRGQYDQLGDVVTAATPAALHPFPKDAPNNRLGLAQWLVSKENPLTARVTVNRIWQEHFGTGLVKTSEDFGTQGEHPSHPELLDWLATHFVDSGWDVKALHRLIVTSAAYRQHSAVNEDLLERDPANRLLARGARYRLDAEAIRDNALAISGLLGENIGGSSVNPYGPEVTWREVSYGAGFTAQFFVQGKGADLYRRSLYTFWKRQSPPANMVLFDAPNRETCTVRRARTNTPLQALGLLNDPQYVEAARMLAQRMMREAADTPEARITHAFALATARPPSAQEVQILQDLYQTQRARYQNDAEAAAGLLGVGDTPPDPALDPADLAAWSTVASIILNLDETITKG
jgi:hypothetical protein